MNTYLTHLVRGDHSLQLAAHLVAGIVSLLLLSGTGRAEKTVASPVVAVAELQFQAPTLVVTANTLNE